MTLGYFLKTFLGFERFVIGDIKGKMGIDWWPTEAEALDDHLAHQELMGTQEEKIVELLVFHEEKDETTLFHPWLKDSDGAVLELTHARFLKTDVFVSVLRNSQTQPVQTVEQLLNIARNRLKN